MTFDIAWRDDTLPLTCRVCSWSGEGEHVADFSRPGTAPLPGVRCPACGSVDLVDEPLDFSPDDASVDAYVEGGVGVETIASCLAQADAGTVRRFLDVGCNYGFALDVGRFLHGWDVVGVEPSYAGKRGAVELGLEIHNVYLDENVDVGAPFDLVLASEVLEHVTDPLGFLQVLAGRLTPSGVLLLTTPGAEVLSVGEPVTEIAAAVSLGYHTFVASEVGLRSLLERAGFAAIQVSREGRSLWAAASMDADAALPTGARPPAPPLTPYFDDRANSAETASALELGMAVRHLRALVNHGSWPEVEASANRAVTAMQARHGLDATRPLETRRAILDGRRAPMALAGLAFALGMQALVATSRPLHAARLFQLVIDAADSWDRSGALDLDMLDLRFQARVHRAIALATVRPERAVDIALDLGNHADPADGVVPVATRQARLLVDLIAHGHYEAAERLVDVVDGHVPELLVGSSEPRLTALDALLSVGILRLNTGDAEGARDWFARCAAAAERWGGEVGERMLGEARRHLELAGGAADLIGRAHTRLAPIHHSIDVYWADASGAFLEGWALAEGLLTHRVEVRSAHRSVVASPVRRDDLRASFPEQPGVADSGFTAYLSGAPAGPLELVLHTEHGELPVALSLDGPVPALQTFPVAGEDDALVPYLDSLPEGPVLMIGQRKHAAWEWERIIRPYGDREVVGIDIHPGHGVHVVGDAHRLSHIFGAESFAAVVSHTVLEHVIAPWQVAAECARVLKRGGLTHHTAPWVWPTHGQPNDFWRFSPEGLTALFSPMLGFELVDAGGHYGSVVVPMPEWRAEHPKMATLASPAMSWLIARKVAAPDPAAAWPYDAAAGARAAQAYPRDGLAPEGYQFGGAE